VAHQLIEHPGRDAVVLQPGREGVAQVVRVAQVQADQVATPGGVPDRPQVAVAEHVPGRRGKLQRTTAARQVAVEVTDTISHGEVVSFRFEVQV
jgi:hypothetical protein